MKKLSLTALLLSSFLLTSNATAAVELITNGGFETGDFTGWTSTDLLPGSGNFSVDTVGSTTPISGQTTAGNANGGNFYAVSDQTGPGTHAIEQTFVIPVAATRLILSFDMFVNNQSAGGTIIDPAGLTHQAGVPNQHGRVDILSAGSAAFDTGAGVLQNLFIGADPLPNPNPYTSYLFDLTSLLTPGGTFDIRFAETDNQLFFNLGFDNVSLLATIPEPHIILLFLAGLLLIAATRSVKFK